MKKAIIAILLIGIILLTGCTDYKKLYNEKTEECKKQIANLTEQKRLEEMKTWGVQQELAIAKEQNKINCDLTCAKEKDEIQRYANELKWCRIQLMTINETTAYGDLQRNYTNLKWRYEECNESLTAIQEAIK